MMSCVSVRVFVSVSVLFVVCLCVSRGPGEREVAFRDCSPIQKVRSVIKVP